jgi:hypothetical protein
MQSPAIVKQLYVLEDICSHLYFQFDGRLETPLMMLALGFTS